MEWAEEFRSLCQDLGGGYAAGMNLETFSKLVKDSPRGVPTGS